VGWSPGFDAARRPGPGDRVYGVGAAGVVRLDEPVEDALYVGDLDGRACFAARVEREDAISLREALATFPADEAALAGRAVQLLDWQRDHRFCGRCGSETVAAEHDASRVCPSCGLSVYARISPAAIMLVTRGDELLLARRPNGTFWSCLAGFVEPGESLEQTVVREVREEVAIEVGPPRYFGSQPWPFPGQLMVGFTVEWASGELEVDGTEIAEARWFGPADELPPVPPPYSIARSLIDDAVRRRAARGRAGRGRRPRTASG
jgi:NAD+ diphosphatase